MILFTNLVSSINPPISYMEVTIDPIDGIATVTSNTCFDYDSGFCLDITVSGSVATCTGDNNQIIDFGGFIDNVFSLKKQQQDICLIKKVLI